MKRGGILCLRCSFVDVTINGKHKGIYILEEHFDSLLIENNNYPEGPIVRFNEEHLFSNRLLFMQAGFSEELLDDYSSTDIDVYRSGKILDDSESFEQYIKAKDLLEGFRAGNLTVEEVFDIDKLATYVVLTDVFGGQHAIYWHNFRFYSRI